MNHEMEEHRCSNPQDTVDAFSFYHEFENYRIFSFYATD